MTGIPEPSGFCKELSVGVGGAPSPEAGGILSLGGRGMNRLVFAGVVATAAAALAAPVTARGPGANDANDAPPARMAAAHAAKAGSAQSLDAVLNEYCLGCHD